MMGSFWVILRDEGLLSFFRVFLVACISRLLHRERRVEVWEGYTLCREEAAEWVAEDSIYMVAVLHSLMVSSTILIGREGPKYATKDFIGVIRKAAFLRASKGGDSAELYMVLDDLKHNKG